MREHVESLTEIAPAEDVPSEDARGCWTVRSLDATISGYLDPPPRDEDFCFAYSIPGGRAQLAEHDPPLKLRRAAEPGPPAQPPMWESTAPPLEISEIEAPARDYLGPFVELLMDTVELLESGNAILPRSLHFGRSEVPVRTPALEETFELGSRTEDTDSRRQPLHGVLATEPAITTLARHWALLRPRMRLAGAPGVLDGFRLRSARDWVVQTSGDPSEMYEYLARVCNVTCQFCYLLGNPQAMAIARGRRVISQAELSTRLRYFAPEEKRGLFHAQWELNEFLVDPKVATLLPELRARSPKPFLFTTNGSPLTDHICDLLASVQPVHVIVSVNTIEAQVRSAVMNERRVQTKTALSSLQRLHERRIPFAISLAAFPDFPIESLERTIEAVRPLCPTMVRVNLPGFTRGMPYASSFDTETQWLRVVEWIREYRTRCDVPIVAIPSAFEADRFEGKGMANAPRIIGTVAGSPAAASGLRPGDRVVRVGIFEIETRAQLRAVLLLSRGQVEVVVDRNGKERRLPLDTTSEGTYPYTGHHFGKYTTPWGIVCAPSLGCSELAQIREHIEGTGARRTWVISSPLMARAARDLIDHQLPDLAEGIELLIAHNDFLGGNIQILDMSTVGDVDRTVRRRLDQAASPDLLLVPGSGFNRHGRDISGRHWGDLERTLNIPTALVDVEQFRF